GFGPVADKLLADPANRGAVFLVSSDASGEGMFISEVAMRERGKFRGGHVVERASKAFTPETGFAKNWSGANYHARFSSGDEMRDFLLTGDHGKNKIDIVVVDDSVPERNRVTHHDQLAYALASDPRHFQLIAESPLVRAGVTQKTPVRAFR